MSNMTKPAPKPVVMLLEDDLWLSELYHMHLSRAGYIVMLAPNSKDVLSLVQIHRPALLITDLLMPDHEGMEAIFLLARRAAAAPHMAALPLIAISSNPVFLEMAQDMVTATLLKPFEGEALVQLVQEVLSAKPVAAP